MLPLHLRRPTPARRLSVLVISVLLLAGAASVATDVPQASADTTRVSLDRPGPTATARFLADPRGQSAARIPPEAIANPDFIDIPASCYTPEANLSPEPCRLVPRKPGAPLIVLWGDSHAWMMTPAIRRAVAHKNVNVIAFMQGACPVMNSDLSTPEKYAARNFCDEFGQSVVQFLDRARQQKRPLRVIVAMAWELYHNAIDPPTAADSRYPGLVNDYIRLNAGKSVKGTPRAFKALSRMRIRTDIVAAEPMVYQTAPQCPTRGFLCPLPRHAALKDAVENNARIHQMRALLSVKGTIIRPANKLCSRTQCQGMTDGVPTYYDRVHIGQRTSYRLASYFTPTVRAVLKEAAATRRGRSR